MQLKDITVSQPLSEELRKRGIPQKSLFYWWCDKEKKMENGVQIGTPHSTEYWYDVSSAFTDPEIDRWLPYELKINENIYYFHSTELKKNSFAYSKPNMNGVGRDFLCSTSGKDGITGKAKMLLYLIDNKLINVEDLTL